MNKFNLNETSHARHLRVLKSLKKKLQVPSEKRTKVQRERIRELKDLAKDSGERVERSASSRQNKLGRMKGKLPQSRGVALRGFLKTSQRARDAADKAKAKSKVMSDSVEHVGNPIVEAIAAQLARTERSARASSSNSAGKNKRIQALFQKLQAKKALKAGVSAADVKSALRTASQPRDPSGEVSDATQNMVAGISKSEAQGDARWAKAAMAKKAAKKAAKKPTRPAGVKSIKRLK